MLAYGKQFIDQDDLDAVARVLQSDYLTTGPEIPAMEADFCAATGVNHAIACSNGTAALHLVAMAMGLGPGDLVIVPTISFVATANVNSYCGAKVVFADVDPDTSLMTPDTLRDAIKRCNGDQLKAVFVVHMGGNPADLETIRVIANEAGAKLVEDACHALGSTYTTTDGATHKIGACMHSDFAIFSLHPVKTITSGEGGVVMTNDAEATRAMEMYRSHGITREPDEWSNHDLAFDGDEPNGWYYEQTVLGYNYRLTDFQAALARSQLSKLQRFVQRRRKIADLYRAGEKRMGANVQLVPAQGKTDPSLHLLVGLFDFDKIGKSRRQVMSELRDRGVGTQVHYVPIHRQPYHQKHSDTPDMPGADAYYARCLSLPIYPAMDDSDVDTVLTAIADVAGG